MKPQHNKEVSDGREESPALTDQGILVGELHSLPGNEILNRILGQKNPGKIVKALSSEDFFWLIKKVGEDDSFPLLELASEDQWQYILDLEIWKRDRLDVTHTSGWLKRLEKADSRRLVRWLFGEGKALAYYYFIKSVEVVVINTDDEIYDIPEGFFSLDGVFHIRVVDSEHREIIENIIRVMADEDINQYQAFLSGLSGVLPAEMGEEMYRMRNVRLAEHGFLPFEEALSVYAYLDPEILSIGKQPELLNVPFDNGIRDMVPVSPLYHADAKNMLTEAISRTTDPIFLDRLRLEFAGLCNQILSADGIMDHDLDILIRTCRRAARYLNLAIERLCGRDISSAEELLRGHSLVSLFRVGFGLALKLKWEAEQWAKGSWFYDQGLDVNFWGERWGGILAGILERRPRFYAGLQKGEEYRDFEWLTELGDSLQVLRRLMVLDSLLERLTELYKTDKGMIQSSEVTFRPLLFNLWSRILLKLEPCFSGISLVKAKELFELLRGESTQSPYRMTGYEETFIKDFMGYVSEADPEAASILKDTLSLIWREFREEYEWVSLDDLDSRYSTFITIQT